MLSHAVGRKINGGELFYDQVEQILVCHFRDLRAKVEALHDGADVGREAVDVAVEIRCELIGVIEQSRQIELRKVVERVASDRAELVADDVLRFGLDGDVLLERRSLGRREDAIKAAQHCQRQDDFAILVPLIRATE